MVSWHGVLVSKEDYMALSDDLVVYGNAFVELVSATEGRRISPMNMIVSSLKQGIFKREGK